MSLNLARSFKNEMTGFLNKNVIITTVNGDTIRGVLLGMRDEDLSMILGDAVFNKNQKNHRLFVTGNVIATMTLGEEPFDILGLRIELEKVFKKTGVRYFPDSRTILVMDRYKVTEENVEGEGPIVDRIRSIWQQFKK